MKIVNLRAGASAVTLKESNVNFQEHGAGLTGNVLTTDGRTEKLSGNSDEHSECLKHGLVVGNDTFKHILQVSLRGDFYRGLNFFP